MSNKPGTYRDLFNMERDISTFGAGLRHLLKPQIASFYSRNTPRLKSLNQHLGDMMKEHVAHDENGKPKFDDKGQFIYLTDADGEEYKAKFDELMARQIDIFS